MNANLELLEQPVQHGEILRLSVKDAMDLMDCSQATVYNRAKAHDWQKIQDEDDILFLIPRHDLLKKKYIKQDIIQPLEKNDSKLIPVIPNLEKELEKIHADYSNQIQRLEHELEQLKQQKGDLTDKNHQLEVSNVRLEERERHLEKHCSTLEKQLEQAKPPAIPAEFNQHLMTIGQALTNMDSRLKQIESTAPMVTIQPALPKDMTLLDRVKFLLKGS